LAGNGEVETTTKRAMAPRRGWVIAVVGVLAGATVGWALVAFLSIFVGENGREISITNRCGRDLYADDGRDGVPIKSGETLRWDGASESGSKTIRLWSSATEHVNGVEALEVTLHGDSVLESASCP
jgi:hypothetical protein